MPPQVHGPSSETAPVVQQGQVNTEETKTAEANKAAQKQEPPKQDAQTAAKNTEAAKQHATGKMQQNVSDAQRKRDELHQRLPDKKAAKSGTTSVPEQRKLSGKQSDDGAWGFVKDTVRMASDAAGAGVDVLRNTTANASAEIIADKANAHIKSGMQKVQDITLSKRGGELAEELKQMSSGKPTFDESQRLIQKIDTFKREVDKAGNDIYLHPLYFQNTVKPTKMDTHSFGPLKWQVKSQFQDEPESNLKNLLGAYGYEAKEGNRNPGDREGRITQNEILDTALHNWRVSSQEERRRLHGLVGPPATYPKEWRTPLDAQVRQENRIKHGEEITLQNEPLGNSLGYPTPRERKNQTDPDIALAHAQKELVDAEMAILASMGGPREGGESPAEPIGTARAPYRGAAPEPISVAETQPGPNRATPRSSDPAPLNPPRINTEPDGLAGSRNPIAKTEPDGLAGRRPPITNTEPDGLAGKQPQPAQPQNNPTNPALANTVEAPPPDPALVNTEPAPAPAQAPVQPLGGTLAADSIAENIAAAGAGAANFRAQLRPTPGAVQEVSVDFALAEMAKGNMRVVRSDSSEFHRLAWETDRGASPVNQQIPVVYRVGDSYRLDFMRLSPADRQRYIEADRQMNPNDYPDTSGKK